MGREKNGIKGRKKMAAAPRSPDVAFPFENRLSNFRAVFFSLRTI